MVDNKFLKVKPEIHIMSMNPCWFSIRIPTHHGQISKKAREGMRKYRHVIGIGIQPARDPLLQFFVTVYGPSSAR